MTPRPSAVAVGAPTRAPAAAEVRTATFALG